jgi:hypothetical protein
MRPARHFWHAGAAAVVRSRGGKGGALTAAAAVARAAAPDARAAPHAPPCRPWRCTPTWAV